MPLLALLAKEPAHGYELKIQLEQIFGEAYPSPEHRADLRDPAAAGARRAGPQPGRRAAARPNKRVYELTDAGREALAELGGRSPATARGSGMTSS